MKKFLNFSVFGILSVLALPISVSAQEVIGKEAMDSIYNLVFNTILYGIPLIAVINLGIKGLSLIADSDNPQKKKDVFTAIAMVAVGLGIAFGAPRLVEVIQGAVAG